MDNRAVVVFTIQPIQQETSWQFASGSGTS